MRPVLGMCLACIATVVVAQTAFEAQLSGQPLMYMKDGKVDGCGIRVIGAVVSGNLKGADAFDASVNIYGQGVGVVKALSYEMSVGPNQAAVDKRRNTPIDRFWLKSPDGQATHPHDGQFHKTEDVGGRIYGVSVDNALNVMMAAITDGVVTLGLKRSAESWERIYFGRVRMTDGEKNQLLNCIDGLIAELSKPR